MSVELQPPELGFRRPFNHEVSQVLRLANHNSEPVAFKVKTTAPKQYCVRPNSGRIEPGGSVEVQVLLQAMKEDPPPDARCRDKFLVQSVAISAASDISNVAQIWANIEQTAKSSIQEKKIRVVFLPADGSDASTNGVSNSLIEDDHPPAYSSPSPTPQRSSVLPPADTSKSPESPTGAVQSTINSATAAVSNATGYSQEDLKRQLDEAKATISRLQQQATDGLRQRKPTSEPKAGASVQKTNPAQAAPSGVSVQIVALLCFISFLLAYLFF